MGCGLSKTSPADSVKPPMQRVVLPEESIQCHEEDPEPIQGLPSIIIRGPTVNNCNLGHSQKSDKRKLEYYMYVQNRSQKSNKLCCAVR